VSETLSRLLGPSFPEPIVLEETGSTNDDLKERARASSPEWTVVLARRQRSGRGRLGKPWASPEGNLFLSVLLRPEATHASLLPLTAGLAVSQALEGFSVIARLKWPNDVLVGERKIAGILAEGLSAGGNLDAVVLGIGVNLLLDPSTLAPPLCDLVTSVEREAGRSPSVFEAAAAILLRLRVWYDSLRRAGPSSILDAFRACSVPWWGKQVEVVSGKERIVGVARDLDPGGGLVLEREDGSSMTLVSGEASLLRRSGSDLR
jgi:BirA family biotin operon repressor/biotin-[acetyl-CoA-carboxylase] ligase